MYKPDYKPPKTPLIPWQFQSRDYNDSSRRSCGKIPPSYLKTDSICYEYDREFIIEDKKEETLEDENMEAKVQVIRYCQLPEIKSNDVNNILDSTDHEVQVGDGLSYANEVPNEGMFILDSNVDAFIGAPNEEDVQPLVEVNAESKIVENNSSIIPHNYSLDVQKFDHMHRKFEMDRAIATYEGCQRATSQCKPLPNSWNFQLWPLELKHMVPSRIESEHVHFFIPNALLVGKQLHPLIALLFSLEKLKALQFFHLENKVKLFHCLDSFFLPRYIT